MIFPLSGLALREAILTCYDLGVERPHCKSDSIQLIKAIKIEKGPPGLYGVLMFEFYRFNLSIFLQWIQKENNKDADALSKQPLLSASSVLSPQKKNY